MRTARQLVRRLLGRGTDRRKQYPRGAAHQDVPATQGAAPERVTWLVHTRSALESRERQDRERGATEAQAWQTTGAESERERVESESRLASLWVRLKIEQLLADVRSVVWPDGHIHRCFAGSYDRESRFFLVGVVHTPGFATYSTVSGDAAVPVTTSIPVSFVRFSIGVCFDRIILGWSAPAEGVSGFSIPWGKPYSGETEQLRAEEWPAYRESVPLQAIPDELAVQRAVDKYLADSIGGRPDRP